VSWGWCRWWIISSEFRVSISGSVSGLGEFDWWRWEGDGDASEVAVYGGGGSVSDGMEGGEIGAGFWGFEEEGRVSR
jgi:hypothetical protein